jgi:acylphosphatase
MDRKRVRVWIKGRVQGVAFRAYTRNAALKEGVKGWVRNLPDDRVEAVFEGDGKKVDRMVAWCYKGCPFSRIDHVEIQEEDFRGEFNQFEIRYW